MRATGIKMAVLICGMAIGPVHADPVVGSVQQALKDQGFYYGGITGTKDADTTAAIRRYQIRNGLQVTGDLNAETQKSLGVTGTPPAAPRVAPTVPRVAPRPQPTPDTSDLRDDARMEDEPAPGEDASRPPPGGPEDESDSSDADTESAGLFDGTPFAGAPPEVQQQVIAQAQSSLARGGYYRSDVDGVFGPGTAFALRAYQTRLGMEPSGRLDRETLAALGLLPGQQAEEEPAPRRRVERVYRPRVYRPPGVIFAPNGERVYIPR